MMIIVEYLNVRTRGIAFSYITTSKTRQYVAAVILGAIPGCLGAYVAVTLFTHKKLSLGALVATMIATSGDEMFVMLALFPKMAWIATGILMLVALATAWLVDRFLPNPMDKWCASCEMKIHPQEACNCFPVGQLWSQLRSMGPYRATLLTGFGLLLLFWMAGRIGPDSWNWKRITLSGLLAIVLFIVATVPAHFLNEHLWKHVVRHHVPRIFLWTFGVLGGLTLLSNYIDMTALVSQNPWLTLGAAGVIGVLPESGPHLIFVTMYAENALPFGVLLASAAVQDGHGMLPLLSASKRMFIVVKSINLVAGLLTGAVALLWSL
ncbi:MAG: arsenic efflux protein [Deltaproteobacteria bacterium]|nr:arsenic efflux protein [Deltaproteobacteria bacterium]MBN2674279.1 arsenic efflux protein [Deltaproteobacteria bacterium]